MPLPLESLTQFECSLHDELPRDPRPRVEVKHHHIGMFEVFDRRVPWVQFDDAELQKSKQARKV